ncbi:hypothetical protein H696_06352 [Fonticula alba]|uniref:Uncharacterized protein n=1 Tax=Fonticula alba TaxID=691883 RepID=A0A058YZC0_FONAL|nr:hypothetical protein H696_06352 [Fonticula alba]KCV67226.1 hypothetical protein H696_06352 [Fonticula alba]|eukprot:XP_009498369.1 hypothetical protein H696_06352 [Fonticula alba]
MGRRWPSPARIFGFARAHTHGRDGRLPRDDAGGAPRRRSSWSRRPTVPRTTRRAACASGGAAAAAAVAGVGPFAGGDGRALRGIPPPGPRRICQLPGGGPGRQGRRTWCGRPGARAIGRTGPRQAPPRAGLARRSLFARSAGQPGRLLAGGARRAPPRCPGGPD